MKLIQNAVAFLLCAVLSIPSTTLAIKILDLNEDWAVGDTNNPFALDWEQKFENEFRDIRRCLIIENGEIVMDYQRDNVKNSDVFNLWSAGKAIMGMLITSIIENESYDLGINTTLAEVFANNENAWIQIANETELEFKQGVTIYELLTMTSGLTFPLLGPGFSPFDISNWVGRNISESLARPTYNATLKGTYTYRMAGNILSYVILETTGMTPFDYISTVFFAHIGIDPAKVQWDPNQDGVQTSLSNLRLTAKQWAKISQLWLQKGLAAPDKRILSEELIETSLSMQTQPDPESDLITHGYFWTRKYFKEIDPTFVGYVYCASGFHGQVSCFSYETGRVSVIQRSNTFWDVGNWFDVSEGAATWAMSTNASFTSPPTISPAPTETPSIISSAFVGGSSSSSWAWRIVAGVSLVGIWM